MALNNYGRFKPFYDIDLLDICFFINAFGSSILIPLIVFYGSKIGIANNEILTFGALKFWLIPIASSIALFLSIEKNIKAYLSLGMAFKGFAFLSIFLLQNYYGFLLSLVLNSIGGIVFSIASSLYIKETSSNVAHSFSKRFTIANIAAAVSPMLISFGF